MLALNSAYRVINVLTAFLTVIVLSRLAGAEGYGMLALFIANVTAFNLFTSFGSEAGIVYHYATGLMQPRRLLRLTGRVLLVQAALLTVIELTVFNLTGQYWLLRTGAGHQYLLILLFLLGISVAEKYAALLNGAGRYTLFSRLQLITSLLMLVTFVVLYLLFPGISAIACITCYVLLTGVQALVYLAGYYMSVKPFGIPAQAPRQRETKLFFSYALLTFFTNAVQFLAYRIDLWFIAYYYQERELGLYGLSVRLTQLFWVLPLVMAGLLYPVIARQREAADTAKLAGIVRSLFTFNAAIGLLSWLVAPYAISFIFGKEFDQSAAPFFLLLPGVILFGTTIVLAAYFSGTGRLWVNFFLSLLCLAVNTAMDAWLVPAMGINGAAIATSAGYGLVSVCYVILFAYRNNMQVHQLFIIQKSDIGKWRQAVQHLIKNKA